MAVTALPRKPRRAWLPWLFGAALLGLVTWRMIYLSRLNDAFDLAFFAGAFLRSFQLGSLYALIALGYTMVYGIIRLINFAHGDVFMVGAFAAYFLFSHTPISLPWALFVAALVAWGFMHILSFWRGRMRDPVALAGGALAFASTTLALSSLSLGWFWALVASMFVTGVLGVLIDRVAYRPLRGAPRNSMLITAIAVSFFLQNFGLLAFTKRQTPFRPDSFWTGFLQFDLAGSTVYTSWMVVLVPLATAVLVVALTLFVNRTRLGRAMRATAQDAETAQMMGVNVDRVVATTFLLGSMLAAAAGVLWGMTFGSINQPAIFGILPGIKAFAAAVIGGIGSLPGAVLGGMLLGFLENFLTALFPRTNVFQGITEYKDTFAFVMLIVILLVKPSGIIGEDLSEKV
ncbi:MAG TPA: branched-chain amino acid ABC transporter permease [Trueperaceae bacterium]